ALLTAEPSLQPQSWISLDSFIFLATESESLRTSRIVYEKQTCNLKSELEPKYLEASISARSETKVNMDRGNSFSGVVDKKAMSVLANRQNLYIHQGHDARVSALNDVERKYEAPFVKIGTMLEQ
ncbi:hypothetical protein LEMLEM_LOCUS22928, partial [Lemmus lemmus]